MKYLMLICLLASGLSYGKEIAIKNLFQIKDQNYDQELIDFFPGKRGQKLHFWGVVRESTIGMMQIQNKIKILEIIDSKVNNNIVLFEANGVPNIKDIKKTVNNIIVTSVEKYKTINIYDLELSSGKLRIFSQKMSINNGYIQSAEINSQKTSEIYISYIDSGIVKIVLMNYVSGKIIWDTELISNEGRVGSIVDMIEVDGSLFLAGVISDNAEIKGWLGIVDKGGSITWQSILNEESVKFSESLAGDQVDVLLENTKSRKLLIEPLSNLVDPKINKVPFLISNYGNYTPWVGAFCNGRYLLISKIVKGKGISLKAIIGEYTGKQELEKLVESNLYKVENGTFINYIPKFYSKLYLGDSFVYTDSDRVLRSGIEFSEVVNKTNCALE